MLQTTNSSDGPTFTVKPARVKNLWITAWCPFCKKPKSYSGTLYIGGFADDDPEAVPVPEMCFCELFQPRPAQYPAGFISFAAAPAEVKNVTVNACGTIETRCDRAQEHEQLQRALRIVQAVAACEGFEDNWLAFCNPERKEDIARQYVADALALLHEAGWC